MCIHNTYIHIYILYIHTYIYTSPEVHQRGHFLERYLTYLWEEDSIFSLNGSLPMYQGNNLDQQDCSPLKFFNCCLCVGHRAIQARPYGGHHHSSPRMIWLLAPHTNSVGHELSLFISIIWSGEAEADWGALRAPHHGCSVVMPLSVLRAAVSRLSSRPGSPKGHDEQRLGPARLGHWEETGMSLTLVKGLVWK